MDEIDPRDRIILERAPLIAMPRYTNFAPLWPATGGELRHRFIVAQDGLWIDLANPWLQLTWPIAPAEMPLPYGEVLGDEIQYGWEDAELDTLCARFTLDAIRVLPNECAAWGVWNAETGTLDYRPLIATEAGPGGITFHRPQLAAHEHLAVDIHSHGTLGAFFSTTDDADDAGSIKLAIVIGNLDTATPSRSMRLCVLGLTIDYDFEQKGVCRVCGCTDEAPCEGGCTWIEKDLCSRCA